MVSHLAGDDDDRKLQASAIQSKNDLTMFHFFLASRASKNELNYYSTVEGKKDIFHRHHISFRRQIPHGKWTPDEWRVQQ